MLRKNRFIYFTSIALVIFVLQSLTTKSVCVPESKRSKTAIDKYTHSLKSEFKKQKLTWATALFIRIFKQSNTLEIWVKQQQQFVLFKSYPICYFSGTIGPKKRTGGNQAPEGIYGITANQMNPFSNYHLSFNVGYPNQFDQFYNYTGSSIMVHGNCVSIGCFAMTDAVIEEIWTLMHASFMGGQQKKWYIYFLLLIWQALFSSMPVIAIIISGNSSVLLIRCLMLHTRYQMLK